MPRKPRLFVDGGVYHVYCKTHRGEMRFGLQIATDSFIDSIATVSSSHQLRVLGFALMSNHYHLVVQTGDVKLWRSIERASSRMITTSATWWPTFTSTRSSVAWWTTPPTTS
jgi:putative transposase